VHWQNKNYKPKRKKMKQKFIAAAALLMVIAVTNAQEKMFTKTGKISFYSKTPIENIEAHNKATISVLDKTSGQIDFSVLMKGFEFEKALMQEHFNENYVESDRFPKANFKGRLTDISKLNFAKDGKYVLPVTGKLTIHGETKEVNVNGIFIVEGGKLLAQCAFTIDPADYKINIPGVVKDKIAKAIQINVNLAYDKM
jgi:polyisoprenoid-binding protein YceI